MTGAAEAAGIRLVLDDGRARRRARCRRRPAPDASRSSTNLLGNAIKFSERGSSIRLVDGRAPTRGSQSSVVDHGRGIPADQLETVFDRFGQVDAGDARREGGTGLGLAIAQETGRLAAAARIDGRPARSGASEAPSP